MVNPNDDSVTFINTATNTKVSTLSTGVGSQPVSVAIAPDKRTAWVLLRKTQQLLEVTGIDTVTPARGRSFATGSEPTGVALAPHGAYAVVANFGETTISVIALNGAGPAVKLDVGSNPRSVVITNDGDGDDSDEKAYVSLFYGQRTGGPELEVTDTALTGKVVEIVNGGAGPALGRTFSLAPIANTGVADGSGNPTGCSPNQLFGMALEGTRLHVTSVCASPKGPVFTASNVFSVVSVIDTVTGVEDTSATGTAVLNKLVNDQKGGAASFSLLGVPVALDFKLGTRAAYVVSQAGGTIQRVFYDPSNTAQPITMGRSAGFAQIADTGAIPLGIVAARGAASKAYVANWVSKDVSVIDLNTQSESLKIASETPPVAGTAAANLADGAKFFFTGQGRWSKNGVSSCAACHPDGNSDGITWVFGAGPRQTTPIDGSFQKGVNGTQRAFNWTGIFDEVHDFELNTRGTQGGKGAITDDSDNPISLTDGRANDPAAPGTVTRNDNLSGSTKHLVSFIARKDWDQLEAYHRTVQANAKPTTLDPAKVTRGRALFEANNCTYCHAGEQWTVSRVPYTPSQTKNGTATFDGGAGLPVLPLTGATGMRTETYGPPSSPIDFRTINRELKKIAAEAALAAPDGGSFNVGPERITCVIRDVGTFSRSNVVEKKADGTQAQGEKGFNPPSLLGLATSAPYFHDGSARTLEEVFANSRRNHHQAFAANFLANGGTTQTERDQVSDLVEFLKSIDGAATVIPVVAGTDICGTY